MTSEQLAKKALDIAQNYKTSYIWGGIGLPITEATLQRAINSYDKNINYAAKARRFVGQKNAFYFDCVGLIKSILWGWNGDSSETYGGAKYASNGVPDISADAMITKCSGVSSSGWDNMVPGEALWTTGHIGIYIGDGLAVECTPAWKNGVQVTAVRNIGEKSGYNARTWKKHGKLPYVSYSVNASAAKPSGATTNTTGNKNPSGANMTPQAVKTDPAKNFSRTYAKTYTVTASALNMRAGASTTKKVIKVLPKGSKVTCYGYYSMNGVTPWLYVKDSTGQTGYCSKKYLK